VRLHKHFCLYFCLLCYYVSSCLLCIGILSSSTWVMSKVFVISQCASSYFVFMGPGVPCSLLCCSFSIFLRDCSQCRVMVACQQFRSRDCSKMEVLLHCSSQPVIESCTKMKFGCFSASYPQLEGRCVPLYGTVQVQHCSGVNARKRNGCYALLISDYSSASKCLLPESEYLCAYWCVDYTE